MVTSLCAIGVTHGEMSITTVISCHFLVCRARGTRQSGHASHWEQILCHVLGVAAHNKGFLLLCAVGANT